MKTQWSKRSVSPRMLNSFASIVPSLVQPSQFRSSIAQAAASPCVQAVEGVALAADVIAVLADQHVEAPDRDVARRGRARRGAGGRAGSASPAASRSRRWRACGPAGRRASAPDRSRRATKYETRSRSVSRMAMRAAASPPERRCASSQASGEFQATSIVPVSSAVDLQLVGRCRTRRRSARPAPRRSRG